MKKVFLSLFVIFLLASITYLAYDISFNISKPEELRDSKIFVMNSKSQTNTDIKQVLPAEDSEEKRILSAMSIEDKVGQMMMFGIEGTEMTESTSELISSKKIGGVILMKSNLENSTQAKRLIENLNKKNEEINRELPLYISVDQEGGVVNRLKFEGIKEYTSQNDIMDSDIAFKVASNRAKELNQFGINVNYSPVVDLVENETDFMWNRAFLVEKSEISNLASKMVAGYKKYGVMSVAKHFLGHPNSVDDLHIDFTIADFDEHAINERVNIFRELIKQNASEMVMVSHVIYPFDRENPCSLSEICIGEYLRKQAEFKGLIITDALEMGAIQKAYSNSSAAVRAVKAGNDIILYTGTAEMQNEAYESILEAVKSGEISEKRIDESVLKIISSKQKHILKL